ncbi:ComF family protein [Mumia sp. zg.B21]|uniref:ComF family protein n=1 Tax=Mumia sp. zg.B21 TaxID=2855447 RepID=UPI001C6E0495|nr:ComF family protein [Mumia sp. zg.B21]MBW9209110.1 ComF family protein [Mumia sp. zg.B21]
MRELLRAAADLVLGVRCAGCGLPGLVLCERCRRAVGGRPGIRAPDPVPLALLRPSLVVPVSLTAYEGVVVELLHAYKEEPRTALARPLGALLAVAVLLALGVAEERGFALGRRQTWSVVLVPVPSRRQAVRARGFDAGAQLARATASALRRQGVRARADPVLRVGRIADQAGLGAAERAANLAGAYRVRRPVVGGAAVVVTDDVVTTGASVGEAVRALTAAGSRPVAVATLAATRRLRRPSQRPLG